MVICARRSAQLINKVKEHCMTLSGKPAYAFQLILQTLKVSKISLLRFREKVGKVDILVNNAGFGIFQEFTEMKPETIRNMFEVNVLG